MRRAIPHLLGLLPIPFLWLLIADGIQLVPEVLLPPLQSVIARLGTLLQSETTLLDFLATVQRWLLGYSLGVFFGVLLGLILGASEILRSLSNFTIEFLRSMPVTAIFPLFLLVFGIGDSSKVAMAFTPTFLILVISTMYGVTLVEPTRRRMAKVFGASRWQVFFRVVAFDALPQIFIGLRLALAQSLIVTIVSEMFIGTDFGLGQRVYDSYLTNATTSLYAFLLLLGCLGYCTNQLMVQLERRVVFWTGK